MTTYIAFLGLKTLFLTFIVKKVQTFKETTMNATILSGITTALYILIELIQFAWMAYLMWKERNSVASRNFQRIRTTFNSA